LIVPMTLNGSGIRDITRVLSVCINTVLKVIREQAALTPEPELPARVADVEVDEMWSFVEKKKRQSWLWYAYSPKTKQVIGYVRGRRTDATCQQLLDKLAGCQITRFYTDHWDSYEKLIPEHRHWIGKQGTQRIERNNLTIRTRLKRWHRRTICFSKSDEMDDAVIKLFIHHRNHPHHKFSIMTTLLYLSQKSVDSFEKKCIMARVEDGLITKHQHASHPRPKLR
jgi:insertion element IS1 protein InsB